MSYRREQLQNHWIDVHCENAYLAWIKEGEWIDTEGLKQAFYFAFRKGFVMGVTS
jgi:hypothetical protein